MRTRKTARSLFNQALCELLEPRQLMSITAYPTDGSTDSVQAQRSEAREIVVTLDTSDTLTTGDLALTLANGDGSGANDGSAGTTVSSVFGTPSLITGDEWAVPVNASVGTSTDASGSLTNGIYTLAVTDGADTSSTSFFRLQGDLNGDGTVNSSDTTLFDAAIGSSVGDPAYLAAADFNKDGVINASDDLQYSHHDLGTDFDFPSISLTASAGTVTSGTSDSLTAIGSSPSYSSSLLVYHWEGGATSFSPNNSLAADATTSTFSSAGTTTVYAVVTDPSGLSATASMSVVVDAVPSSLVITPAASALGSDGTTTITGYYDDQFGDYYGTLSGPLTWSADDGGAVTGSSSIYTYTAPAAPATATVSVTTGSVTSNTLSEAIDGPTVYATATATLSDNTIGSTPTLVLTAEGDDLDGESTLTYTWSVANQSGCATTNGAIQPLSVYYGAAPANFNITTQGTHAGSTMSASMDTCGQYTFTCTITDLGGDSCSTSVNVNVAQKLSSLNMPASYNVGVNSAYALDELIYNFADTSYPGPTNNSYVGTNQITSTPMCLDQFGVGMAAVYVGPTHWTLTTGGFGPYGTLGVDPTSGDYEIYYSGGVTGDIDDIAFTVTSGYSTTLTAGIYLTAY